MKFLFFIILLFLLGFTNLSFAVEGATIAVYTDNGNGAWEDGIIAFEQFLKWKGVTYERVSPLDVNTVNLKNYYDAIYFPGGDADYYNAAINQNGIQHIRELINEGGGYIGICAGAEFACDTFIWEGVEYDYPLDLFSGQAIGPIDIIAPWPNYTMTTITMNSKNPINQYEPASEIILYYGGSAFYPNSDFKIDTVATWDSYNNNLAIINFYYGNGRVLLLGPHPEIEEDSDRDSTDVAQELNDEGSDWPFLWSAVDWLLGYPITSPSTSSINRKLITKTGNTVSRIENYPNPFNSSTTIKYTLEEANFIRLEIYTLTGQLVKRLKNKEEKAGDYFVKWDGKDVQGNCLSSGIYLSVINIGNIQKSFRRIILLK